MPGALSMEVDADMQGFRQFRQPDLSKVRPLPDQSNRKLTHPNFHPLPIYSIKIIIFHYQSSMQLIKQNILPLQTLQVNLSTNFTRIEQEMRKLRREIAGLWKNSDIVIGKINQLDLYGCLDFMAQGERSRDGEGEGEKDGDKIGMGDGDSLSKINVKSEAQVDSSLTVINARQNLQQLCNKENQPTMPKRSRQAESRQSQVSVSVPTRQVQPKKQPIPAINPRQNSHDSMLKQFIKDLEARMTQLEQQKNLQNSKLDGLQKDNEIFKKMLGFKEGKTGKNRKNRDNGHGDEEREKGERRSSKTVEKVDDHVVEEAEMRSDGVGSEQKLEQCVGESNFIISLKKEIEQLREWIKNKTTHLDTNVQKCLHTLSDTTQKLTQLAQHSSETDTKLLQLQTQSPSNEPSYLSHRKTPSIQNRDQLQRGYNKTKTSTSELGNLNDTVESYRNYYEDKIVEIFQEMDRIRSEYFHLLAKLDGDGEQAAGTDLQRLKNIAEKISHVSTPNEEKLKKQVNSLKKQHKKLREQFNELMGDLNTGTGQTRTLVIKANENKEDWKDVTQKIYKLRQQLLSYVKDLETKINLNNDMTIVIQELEVGISECKILNGKKVNIVDFQKFGKRIQGRLNNFIRQVCEKEGMAMEQEALIAKQPWFCLSCDSEIKNYTGKLGKPIYNNEKMTGKKVNPESHMIRRPESKLPSVH